MAFTEATNTEELKRLYGSPDRFEWYGHQPLLSSFSTIAIQVEDHDWQGDSRILYDDDGRIGFLMYGWGSCSGCDAFYGCNTFEEAAQFSSELFNSIKWFDGREQALEWFKTHDWEGDYSGRDENTKFFVELCIKYLEHEF